VALLQERKRRSRPRVHHAKSRHGPLTLCVGPGAVRGQPRLSVTSSPLEVLLLLLHLHLRHCLHWHHIPNWIPPCIIVICLMPSPRWAGGQSLQYVFNMPGVQASTIEALGVVCPPEASTGVEFPPVMVPALLALYDSRSEGSRIVPPDFESTAVPAFQATMGAAPSWRLWLLDTPTWGISPTSPRPCSIRSLPPPLPWPLNYARGLPLRART